MDYTRCIACKQSLSDYTYDGEELLSYSGYDIGLFAFNTNGEKQDSGLGSLHDGYLCGDCAQAALHFAMNRAKLMPALADLMEETLEWDVAEVGGEPLRLCREQAAKAILLLEGKGEVE